MQKQIRKAMLCTIAMMLIAVVTLTGVTYAWFSESDEAYVNGLNMAVVKSSGGVYISTTPSDPGSFGDSVDISPADGEIFSPVSTSAQPITAEGDYKGMFKFYEGTLTGNNDTTLVTTEVKPEQRTGKYIFSYIYFDNSSSAEPLTVSLEGTEIKPTGAYTHLATRLAIVNYGSITLEEYANGAGSFPAEPQYKYKTEEGGGQSIVGFADGVVQIFENDSGTHTVQGKNEYKKLYPTETNLDQTFKYFAVTRTTTATENGEEGTTGLNRFNKTPVTQTGGWLQEMTTKTIASDVKITIPAGCLHKIALYVWIEGQDADCQNNISSDSFTAAIVFKQVEAS